MSLPISRNNAEEPMDIANIPIRALNVSCRTKLSLLLNPETLTDKDGYNRDYRGLAELLGFEHDHIMSFMRESDPTAKILHNWELEPESTIGNLFSHLEFLDRFDVIDQVKPIAERNAREFLRRQANNQIMPVQVPEISSDWLQQLTPDNPEHLTLLDATGLGPERFDAYVCYAEEDEYFVIEHMVKNLELRGIHLCIKDRNILPSRFEDDSIIRIIEERCSRMVIVWSPEFSRSPQCDFLSKFATGLTVEQQRHKIIPVIYKHHPMPGRLRFLSKVDFTRPNIQCWFWDRLVISLKQDDAEFILNHMSQSNMAQALPPSQENAQLPPAYRTEANPAVYERVAIQDRRSPSPIVQSPTPSQSVFFTSSLSCQSSLDTALPSLDSTVSSEENTSFTSSERIGKENKSSSKVKKMLNIFSRSKKDPNSKNTEAAPR